MSAYPINKIRPFCPIRTLAALSILILGLERKAGLRYLRANCIIKDRPVLVLEDKTVLGLRAG